MRLRLNNMPKDFFNLPFYLILFESIVSVNIALIEYLYLLFCSIYNWRNIPIFFIGIGVLVISLFAFSLLAKIEHRKWVVGILVYVLMIGLSNQINIASSILIDNLFIQSIDYSKNILSSHLSIYRPLFIASLALFLGVCYTKNNV